MIAFALGMLAAFAIVAIVTTIWLNRLPPERERPPVQWGALSVPRSYAPESNAPDFFPASLKRS